MAKDTQDIINQPIKPEDYASEDEGELDLENDIDMDVEDVDDVNIDADEIDPVGDEALDDLGELDDAEFDAELDTSDISDLPNDEPTEFIPPEEQVKWTAVPQENGSIWSEHVDGFVLRARPLSAQQGDKIKYIAQLFKDGKMIEKGVIWIESDVDSREYLQNVADRILDRMGLVNMALQNAEPVDEMGGMDEMDEMDEIDFDEEEDEEDEEILDL